MIKLNDKGDLKTKGKASYNNKLEILRSVMYLKIYVLIINS